ncbi:MAG TPA: hypothetical protein VN622_14260 [Clostridia bacterium]|nr:hypothetical protein [Clostridia bacterium]
MNDVLDAEQMKRLRGQVLEILYANHRAQRPRLDSLTLWGALRRLLWDLGRNDVRTVLQDLKRRGYVSYTTQRDKDTNRETMSQIMIEPKGTDLVEGPPPTDDAIRLD